jgi:hypothetical protein
MRTDIEFLYNDKTIPVRIRNLFKNSGAPDVANFYMVCSSDRDFLFKSPNFGAKSIRELVKFFSCFGYTLEPYAKTKNGVFIFPKSIPLSDMTLRDFIAVEAMQGLLASGMIKEAAGVAETAYKYSDDMIEERKRNNGAY